MVEFECLQPVPSINSECTDCTHMPSTDRVEVRSTQTLGPSAWPLSLLPLSGYVGLNPMP